MFVDNNAKWIFEQHSNNDSELFELRSYIMAKLLWNPNLDFQTLLNEFNNKYYGNGGKYISEYVNSIQNQIDNTSFFLFLYGDPSQGFDSFLSPENLLNYDILFNKALNSVELDSEYYKRILRSKISIDYAVLESYRKNFSDLYQLTKTENDIKSINPKLIIRLVILATIMI